MKKLFLFQIIFDIAILIILMICIYLHNSHIDNIKEIRLKDNNYKPLTYIIKTNKHYFTIEELRKKLIELSPYKIKELEK